MKVLNELKVAVQSQNVQCQTLGLQYYNMIETMRIMSEKVDKLSDCFNNTKNSIFDKINDLSQNFSTLISATSTTSNIPAIDRNVNERIDRMEENLIEKINTIFDIIKTRPDDLYDVYQENDEDFDKINYDQTSCIQNTYSGQNQMSALNFSTSQLPFSSTLPFQQFGLFNQVSQSNPMPVFPMPSNPNVNITSSDTLPTGPPVSQPPLSVIIPTHHVLGNITTSEAQHSYPFKFSQSGNQSQSVITHGAPNSQPMSSISQPLSFQSSLSTFKEGFETSLNKSRNSATDDSYTEEHDPIPEFQPIIPLPDKIEEFTGEENDTILFERRAKLYKYVEKEWKEKGIGLLKILKNNDTGHVRLVMRRDQVHKVCANHFLYDNMELKPKGDKAVVWSANDFSDAVKVQVESLCARFKIVEDCEEFTRVFNENKQPCSQNTSLVEDSYISDNHNDSIIEVNKDSCLTLTSENEKSLKHQLGGFTFSLPPVVKEISTPKQQDKTPEKPKGLFSNLNFATSIDGKETPSFNSLLSKPTFTISESKTDSDEKQLFSFNLSKSGFLSAESTPKSTEKSPVSLNASTEKSAMFTPKLDFTSGTAASYFSTLAKSSPNTGFTNSPDFKGFPGAGTTIFNVKTNPSPHAIIKPPNDVKNDSTAQSHDESEDFIPTIEFKPVIPLPDKVDVVTGEEGLEVVYEDRAKLLRFEPKTKEWKEKGIGQMKILHNPTEGYYQLLMRRELVFKVCCNQRLSADIVLKPVTSSEKAVSWIGQDFSEGECRKELFAIRFKTVDQLNAFKDKFNEVKNKIQDPKNVESNNSNIEQNVSKTLPKLNELAQFKPKPGSWTCNACYLSNAANIVKCVACSTVKPGAVVESTSESKSTTSFTFGIPTLTKVVEPIKSSNEQDVGETLPKLNELAQFKPKPGSWNCNACYLSNDANTVKCVACSTVKPGAVIESISENNSTNSFTFGQSSFPSMFKFGNTTLNSQPDVPFVMPKFGTSSEVSFGSLSTSGNTNVSSPANKTDLQKKPLTWREESAGLVKYDSDKSNDDDDGTDNESDGYDGRKSVVENEKSQFSFSNG